MTKRDANAHLFRIPADNWGVSTAQLDQIFGGFHSRRFADELSRLSYAHDLKTALPALLRASSERRNGNLGARIAIKKIWQPVDVKTAAMTLGRSMSRLEPKPNDGEQEVPTPPRPTIEPSKTESEIKPPETSANEPEIKSLEIPKNKPDIKFPETPKNEPDIKSSGTKPTAGAIQVPKTEPAMKDPTAKPDIKTSVEAENEDFVPESPWSIGRTTQRQLSEDLSEESRFPLRMSALEFREQYRAHRGSKRSLSWSDDAAEHLPTPPHDLTTPTKRPRSRGITAHQPYTTEAPCPPALLSRPTLLPLTPAQSVDLGTPRTSSDDVSVSHRPPPQQHTPAVLADTGDALTEVERSPRQSSLLYRPLPPDFCRTLLSMCRLNDDAVNTCLKIIASASAPTAFQVISSLLIKPNGRPPSPAVKKPILAAETILAPLHLSESNHWVLCSVDRATRKMVVYDSLRKDPARHRHVKRLVEVLVRDYFDPQPPFEIVYQYGPLQGNGVDCGVSVLIQAIHILVGRPLAADSPQPNAQLWRYVFASLDNSANVPDWVPNLEDAANVEIDLKEAPAAPSLPSSCRMSARQWLDVKAQHTAWQDRMQDYVQQACHEKVAHFSTLGDSVQGVQGVLQKLFLVRAATAAGPAAAEIDQEILARQQILQGLKGLPGTDRTDEECRAHQAACLRTLGEARTYKQHAEQAFLNARTYLDRQQDLVRERKVGLEDHIRSEFS